MNSNPFRKIYLEAIKGDQHKLDVDNDKRIEAEDLAKLRAKKMKKEETEQIDELDKKTLASYAYKAAGDATDKARESERRASSAKDAEKRAKDPKLAFAKSANQALQKHDSRKSAAASKKSASRLSGVLKAASKLAYKEEVDLEEGSSKNDLPFDGPYTKTKPVKNSDGTIQSPMSRARELAKKALAAKAAKMKEEVEQIDELSKSTLGSYVKRASRDSTILRKIGADFERKADAARSPGMKAASTELSDKYKSKSRSRRDGLDKAVDRLTKEEGYYEKPASAYRRKGDEVRDPTPVAPVPDRKYIKGTPENKALKASRKPINGMPTEEVEQIEEKSDQAKQNKTMKNLMAASRGARYKLNNPVPDAEPEHKTARAHNVAIGRAAMKAEETQMEFTQEELQLIEQFIEIAEKMNMSKASMGDVIKDFKKSDAPQFAGKSMEKRREMAIAAKLSADRETKKEETELVSFKGFVLDEIKMSDLPSRKVSGKYGTEYYKKEKEKDEKGYDADDEDTPSSEKRGRGRPKGSSSGARQKGSTPKKKGSGVEMTGYPLHLPNSK